MPPRKKKAEKGSVGLDAAECGTGSVPAEVKALGERVVKDGGALLGTFREPLGGHWVMLATLPIDKLEPTPYQRELSPTHAKRLATVIPKVGRFLDPVITVPHDGGWWTPNGMHRLNAMRTLGARAITALIVPEREVAFRILALNTEKAHNLRDKSLEVVRMARALAEDKANAKKHEAEWAFEFEQPGYLTVGLCYEQNGRFSGGAYMPVVSRCDEFADVAIAKSLEARGERAKRLLELDEAVGAAVQRLKDAGLKSAYLKPFVIARINPLRWIKPSKPGEKSPRAEFDATMDKMLAGAKKLDASKIKASDLAAAAAMGPPPSEE